MIERFPNTHTDNKDVGLFSLLSREALEEKIVVYTEFVTDKDTMKRAELAGRRVLLHAMFELDYRKGFYDEIIEDENGAA